MYNNKKTFAKKASFERDLRFLIFFMLVLSTIFEQCKNNLTRFIHFPLLFEHVKEKYIHI